MDTPACDIRVGPAGWSYEDWKGIVYPDAPGRDFHPLRLLAAHFDLVEINATFYRPAAPQHALAWLRHVEDAPRFRFAAKLWEVYTHGRSDWPDRDRERQFRDGIAPLVEAGRLAAVLVQFPWSFRRTPENRQWLGRILETFSDLPMAVELRHSSWDTEALYVGLAERGVAFCNIDQPVIGDSIAPAEQVTAPFAYARLHGRNYPAWFNDSAGRNDRYNYLYSDDELEPWIARFKRMERRVNDLLIVTNNHYQGQAVVNALEIQAALGRITRDLPASLVARYPRLLRLAPP